MLIDAVQEHRLLRPSTYTIRPTVDFFGRLLSKYSEKSSL